MRRLLAVLAFILVFSAIGSRDAQAAPINEGWRIESFDVVYTADKDGTLEATETLKVDFGSQLKHGIFRYFFTEIPCGKPLSGAQQPLHPCNDGQYRRYHYQVESVRKADQSDWKYSISNDHGRMQVKIGDKDVQISGKQEYVIKYQLTGAFDEYEDHQELYWNAMGQWPAEVDKFTLTLKLPEGAETKALCYQGPHGSNQLCNSQAGGSTIQYSSNGALAVADDLTIVAGWQPGLINIPPPDLSKQAKISDFFKLDALEYGGLALSVVGGIALAILAWWRFGRDRAYLTVHYLTDDATEAPKPLFGDRPEVVVEYLPPEGLRPAQMGVLLDERADTLDVTATIVDLAVRGYLHITELPKEGWFGHNDWKLNKMKEPDDLNAFEAKVFRSLFSTGDEVELSDLKYKFAEDLAKAKDLIYDDAMKQKWFQMKPETARGMWVIVTLGVLFLAVGLCCFAALFIHRGLFFAGLLPAGLLFLILSRSMARRTAQGSEMLRRVLGFRLYISTAEKDRQHFNEVENIFARYLPFAIVFGCVNKWAKAFEGLGDTAEASTRSWYTGVHPFAPALFASNLQTFSSSVGSTLASSHSSGSGFSGGSSGGGGGGGGGGSW
jgi:uncharacterized membrane protein YgcG